MLKDLLQTLQTFTVALLLTAGISAAQSSAPALTLPLDSYPAKIRNDLARPYEAARAHPSDANALGALGRILQAWEQWESAHDAYSRAIALAPNSLEWRYLDACVLDRLARPEDAATQLREVLKIQPSYLPARARLADALL